MSLVISGIRKKKKKSQTNKQKNKPQTTHIYTTALRLNAHGKKESCSKAGWAQKQQQNNPKLNIFCHCSFQRWHCEYTTR